ncbi:STKc type histidine kinase [Melanogaster broomeanus]|nr:STKc type histidine kinase [Melanogaster broomeanus]
MPHRDSASTTPTLYFKDNILSVPGYTFQKACLWHDTGSSTLVAEGSSLKDGALVLAKIAPAHSSSSICLEREAHILGKMSESSEAHTTTLRLIEFLTVPRADGDCVVLLLVHPVNDFLLADIEVPRLSDREVDVMLPEDLSSPTSGTTALAVETGEQEGDLYDGVVLPLSELDLNDLERERFDVMDLASFLEYADPIRANAFHLNMHSGVVRLVHFGNRAVSLEESGGPSQLVINKVVEALHYLAPEQLSCSPLVVQEDHRADLYSLGMLFWTSVVGRGRLPFTLGESVSPAEVLAALVRGDVPLVIGEIIDKLLSKNPDARYQSAYGLKADLLECQRRLLSSVSTPASLEHIAEMIPAFEIGTEDKFSFGRDKELEIVRNVMRNSMTSFARTLPNSQGYGTGGEDGGTSSSGHSSEYSPRTGSSSQRSREAAAFPHPTTTSESDPSGSGGLRKGVLKSTDRSVKPHAVMIVGSGGVGKTSIVLAHQAKWKAHGLWAHAKFQATDNAPFAALVTLSVIDLHYRQLASAPADAQRFVQLLTERLGPQLINLPLLFAGAADVRTVLESWGINVGAFGTGEVHEPSRLATGELEARFQSLMGSVISAICDVKFLALFLDDLHEADTSTLDLVEALLNSRSRLIIFATMRPTNSDHTVSEILDRIRSICSQNARTTWITLEELSYSAISNLVAKSLHRTREACSPLSRVLYTASRGNIFLARSVLIGMQRRDYITFDWARNHWHLIDQKTAIDPTDQSFLISHFRELPLATRKYLVWASFFGTTFRAKEVALLIDWEDSSGSSSDEEGEENWDLSKTMSVLKNRGLTSGDSMRGLQGAINEGWLIQRGPDTCSFAHDRYRQAVQQEASTLSDTVLSKMSFRIILAMLHDTVPDVHRIAEHARRCIPLLREQPNREELLDVLIGAGDSAWERGAHELALQAFWSAKDLLSPTHWVDNPKRDLSQSEAIIAESIQQAQSPEDHAQALRLRANNLFMRNEFADALKILLSALHILGVDVNAAPTKEEADKMFEEIKEQILAIGFEDILRIPRTMDYRIDLAVCLLNDAGTNTYWTPGEGFIDVVGMTVSRLVVMVSGISPGSSLGFFWAIGAAAERMELFKFSADLGKLALRIAYMHGGSMEKCRATVLYLALVAPFDNTHLRTAIPYLSDGYKHGHSSGDRVWTSFSAAHLMSVQLFTGEHCVLNCIRAIGGYTDASSVETVFNTDHFDEHEYTKTIEKISGNQRISFNWWDDLNSTTFSIADQVAGLFCTGFIEAAAELGFSVFETRDSHPNHRHTRYSAFFHSLALVSCIRRGDLTEDQRNRYSDQIAQNQAFIRKWLAPSPVNTGAWIALVEAELASLYGNNDALRLYDMAVELASSYDWPLEEGFALYLQGCHLIRSGVEGLGRELQHRGISKQSQWGALGIVRHLTAAAETQAQRPRRRSVSLVDAGIQTDVYSPTHVLLSQPLSPRVPEAEVEEDMLKLRASALMLIIQRSKDISDCISLSSEICQSEYCCIVITTQSGEFGVATILTPPEICQVFENPRPLHSLANSAQVTIIQSVLDSKHSYHQREALPQLVYHAEGAPSSQRSIICLPIFSNRGCILGALYIAARSELSHATVTTVKVLCQQASVSISSALLFRSVQAGTRENLKMIASQREALEAARKSREDAITATRVKSRFIANMSHEMRTPFSSFYGLLDLLSGTELNSGQRELVETAKQSCEILLKIIDSILDYSKLEASAMKLDLTGFCIEDVMANCLELFLPQAAKKLDLSYYIEENVPKFDYAVPSSPEEIFVKFAVQDTGIGLSPNAAEMLFVPFQQADNSSTRRFGGTGLGLSISRQLVRLLGGTIGVDSDLGVGSVFWFTLPVKLYSGEDSRKAALEIERLQDVLSKLESKKVIVCSPSPATRGLLRNILKGFDVILAADLDELWSRIAGVRSVDRLDFVILDDQLDSHMTDLISRVLSWKASTLQNTRIIHMYTPTTDTLSDSSELGGKASGVSKLIKPPRQAQLSPCIAVDGAEPTARTLYGNILVAEVSLQQTMELRRFEGLCTLTGLSSNLLTVYPAWEAHEPGHFALALFDHHMPVCDGVEATKRLRKLENAHCSNIRTPSADAQESTKQLCLSAGMDMFLSKPLRKIRVTCDPSSSFKFVLLFTSFYNLDNGVLLSFTEDLEFTAVVLSST